jgi:hypothetical protein
MINNPENKRLKNKNNQKKGEGTDFKIIKVKME